MLRSIRSRTSIHDLYGIDKKLRDTNDRALLVGDLALAVTRLRAQRKISANLLVRRLEAKVLKTMAPQSHLAKDALTYTLKHGQDESGQPIEFWVSDYNGKVLAARLPSANEYMGTLPPGLHIPDIEALTRINSIQDAADLKISNILEWIDQVELADLITELDGGIGIIKHNLKTAFSPTNRDSLPGLNAPLPPGCNPVVVRARTRSFLEKRHLILPGPPQTQAFLPPSPANPDTPPS